jgi:hypothetical protein
MKSFKKTEAKKIMNKNYKVLNSKVYDYKLYRSLKDGKLNKPYEMDDKTFDECKTFILDNFNKVMEYHERMNHEEDPEREEAHVIYWSKENYYCELIIAETMKPDYNETVEMLKTKKNRWTRVSVDPITQECTFKYKGIEFKGNNSTIPIIRALSKPTDYSNVPERIMWNYLEGIL